MSEFFIDSYTEINSKILLPTTVMKIINAFYTHGVSAFLVGGCVRDMLVNQIPKDYDFCTPASTKEITKVLRKNNIPFHNRYEQYGTIVARIEDEEFEITTYRKESDYSDGRHPDVVEFTDDIIDDLSRRDLTINAIAYNPYDGVIDPFGGMNDLHDHIIRCVGDANKRIKEDSLRILRVLRFAVKFEATVDQATSNAIHEHKDDLISNHISKERITAEIRKLLSYHMPISQIFNDYRDIIAVIIPDMEKCFDFSQNNKYHKHDIYQHILAVVDNCADQDFLIRMAALLHDIGKPVSYHEDDLGYGHFYGHPEISFQLSQKILTENFRLTTQEVNHILALVKNHDISVPNEKTFRRAVNKLGIDIVKDWIPLHKADMMDHTFTIRGEDAKECETRLLSYVKTFENSDVCVEKNKLAIDGNDIMNILHCKPGKKIGEILSYLLSKVMDEELENNKHSLEQAVIDGYLDESEIEYA